MTKMQSTLHGGTNPGSLWAASNEALPDFKSLQGKQETDVLVIGAGYTGLTAALHLAKKKIPVMILEAREPGWGASGRNGGQVIPGLFPSPQYLERQFGKAKAARYLKAALAIPDELFDLVRHYKIDCEALQPGYLHLAHSRKFLQEMAEQANQIAEFGGKIQMLTKTEIQNLTGSAAYEGGYCAERGGSVQPLKLVLGLARAADQLGVEIKSQSPVQKIERQGNRWRATSERGQVMARKILICTNAYTDQLEPRINRSLVLVRSFQVATTPLPTADRLLKGGHAASDTRRLLSYFRSDEQGRLIMGGRAPFKHAITLDDAGPLRKAIARIYPQLADQPLEYCWAGRIGMTIDHLPRLVALAPNMHAALGYNGRGVALSALFGRCLAQLASGTAPDNIDVPVSSPKPIFLHALSGLGARTVIQWRRMRDRIDDLK